MKIRTIKTEKIIVGQTTLAKFLDKHIKKLQERSIVVITSKVISIIENRVESLSMNKDSLIKEEADFLTSKPNKYGRFATIKYNALISGAGIDESNGNGAYILLPENPQKTAKKIYQYLSIKFGIEKFGIIITDSRSMPLRVGAMGVAIGFSGFSPLKSYIGKEDIFGRKLKFEKANVVDALASAAVLAMGEGREQTPIAIIEDLEQINFNESKPSARDLKEFYVSMDDDIFHQFYDCFK